MSGSSIVTGAARSYVPPTHNDGIGGGGPIQYPLFPGVIGSAVNMKDGSVWITHCEPEKDDWGTGVVENFLNALHRKCRVVGVSYGELLLKLSELRWQNIPQVMTPMNGQDPFEVDVWYPPSDEKEDDGVQREKIKL